MTQKINVISGILILFTNGLEKTSDGAIQNGFS